MLNLKRFLQKSPIGVSTYTPRTPWEKLTTLKLNLYYSKEAIVSLTNSTDEFVSSAKNSISASVGLLLKVFNAFLINDALIRFISEYSAFNKDGCEGNTMFLPGTSSFGSQNTISIPFSLANDTCG